VALEPGGLDRLDDLAGADRLASRGRSKRASHRPVPRSVASPNSRNGPANAEPSSHGTESVRAAVQWRGVAFVPVRDLAPTEIAVAWRHEPEDPLVRAFVALTQRAVEP
jgi:hypothetical protein